jgi:exosortase/archaeosortase family protein
MWLKAWTRIANHHRRTTVLAGLLTSFAGVALLIDRPKETLLEWLGIPLVASGVLLLLTVWPPSRPSFGASTSVANRLLRRLTWDGRLVPFFPAMGVAIIVADLVYNVTLSPTPALQTEDTIVLLGAFSLLGYQFVPARLARERDFVLLFFLCLNAILVLPLLAARAYFADAERSVDVYSWVALAPETSALLSLLGVGNSVHAVAGSTAPGLTFTPQQLQVQVTVVITTACSGIYSFGIFAAAFVAFVFTEYERPSKSVWLFLILGMMAAYVANVLRMAVIVLVGYYSASPQTELQDMLLAHSYAGWIIFLGWIGLFWGILFKFLPKGRIIGSPTPVGHRESQCVACTRALSPTIAAVRCSCGAYYHVICIAEELRCLHCGKAIELGPERTTVVIQDWALK